MQVFGLHENTPKVLIPPPLKLSPSSHRCVKILILSASLHNGFHAVVVSTTNGTLTTRGSKKSWLHGTAI